MIAKNKTHKIYDRDHDIFYVDIGKPCAAYSEEIYNGIFVRINPKNNKVVGMTIFDYKNKELDKIAKEYPAFSKELLQNRA